MSDRVNMGGDDGSSPQGVFLLRAAHSHPISDAQVSHRDETGSAQHSGRRRDPKLIL